MFATSSLCFIIILFAVVYGQRACFPPTGEPSCVCDTGNGIIDLTSIAASDGPRFSDIGQSDGNTEFTYSYNLCTGYTDYTGTNCYGPVAARQSISYETFYSLGDPSTETMYIDDAIGDIYLQYDNGDDGRISIVFLNCDPSATDPSLTADGDGQETYTYVFHLTSNCACPGGCSDQPIPTTDDNPTDGGSSGIEAGPIGIALIMLAFAGLIAYFIVGSIIMNKKFGKTGKEMIPQVEFWTSLPHLIKDGFVFTFGPIINLVRRKTGGGGESDYEPIK